MNPRKTAYNFDQPEFDSYSGRLSWNPTRNLALQVSYGYIKSPEALEPDLKRHRTTASVIYNLPLGRDSNWSNTFVWGQNHDTGEGKTQSFLVESDYQRGRNTVYLRWERVEKSGHELVLNTPDESRIFPVSGYTLGYVRDLSHGNGLDIGLGTQFTINDRPERLDRYYGDDLGYGIPVFRPHSSVLAHSQRARTLRAYCRGNGKISGHRVRATCSEAAPATYLPPPKAQRTWIELEQEGKMAARRVRLEA